MSRSQRDKGARSERDLVKKLRAAGLDAKRVPLSGACDGFKGDVVVSRECPVCGGSGFLDDCLPNCQICAGGGFLPATTFECKVRANGFKQIYAWLPDEGVLAIKSDRNEWLIVERLDSWVQRL